MRRNREVPFLSFWSVWQRRELRRWICGGYLPLLLSILRLQIFLFFADPLLFVCSRTQKYLHSTELYPKNDGGGPIVSKKEKEKENKKKESRNEATCSLLSNGGCCIFLMRCVLFTWSPWQKYNRQMEWRRIGGGAASRRAICGVDRFSNCRKTLASEVPKSANVIRNGTVHRSRFSTQEYFILYQENPRFHRGVP